MRLSSIVRSIFPALPLIALLGGCDAGSTVEPASPPAIAPSADQVYTWGGLTLVTSDSWLPIELSHTVTIGRAGGVLRLGLHELVVPAGAVENPTRFTMTHKFGNRVVVDLTAVDRITGELVTQFPVDLQLKLSYLLVPVPRNQADDLIVVWVKEDGSGELVPVPTIVNERQRYVIGAVNHFSRFAMAM